MPVSFPIHTHLNNEVPVQLTLAEPGDTEPVCRLFRLIVDEGKSYPHEQMELNSAFQTYWFEGGVTVVASVLDQSNQNSLVGAYYLKANWPGRASHVANAGFIVAPEWRRQGLGLLLGKTMLEHARIMGFVASSSIWYLQKITRPAIYGKNWVSGNWRPFPKLCERRTASIRMPSSCFDRS